MIFDYITRLDLLFRLCILTFSQLSWPFYYWSASIATMLRSMLSTSDHSKVSQLGSDMVLIVQLAVLRQRLSTHKG
jgi:hypothetical protein